MMNALRSAIAHAPTPRSMMLRRIVLPAMACVLVSLANTVSAVGLGEAHTSSRIGQTLRIEIPIQSEQGEPISATCFRLAAPPASDSDDLPWLSSARLGIDEANGNRQLIIVGAQTNENPIVRFGVVIGCDVGLRRDYTLLLDPPDFNATGPVVSESNSPPIAPTWTQSLAQSPSTASAATTISPEFATPPATPVAAKSMLDSSVPSVPKRKRTRTAPHDRLVVGTTDSGEGSALQLATSIAKRNDLSEKERAKLRLELQLIATLDDKIATQVELTDKLRQLEALQAKLQTDSNELEAQIHAQQIKNQTLIPPRPVAVAMQPVVTKQILPLMPERIWLYLPGGLLALLLVTWFWLRRSRYQSDEEHSIAVPKTPGGGATAAGHADEMFEPLSEADIWPEHKGRDPVIKPKATVDGNIGPLSVSGLGTASVLQINDVEEHDSAVELADIMMSFGRVHGAAQTLADFIRANPRQAVKPWIKLLEVYRAANMRTEFDGLTAQLNKTFNIQPVNWDNFEVAFNASESLESLEHIRNQLCETWGKRDCQAYLHGLLRDNRQGTRQGFPLAIVDEILLLLAILETHLGPYKAEDHVDPPAPAPTHAPATVAVDVDTSKSPANTTVMLNPDELEKKDFAATTPANFTTLSNVDFEFDMGDFSRTLHINLDELGEETVVGPAKTPGSDS